MNIQQILERVHFPWSSLALETKAKEYYRLSQLKYPRLGSHEIARSAICVELAWESLKYTLQRKRQRREHEQGESERGDPFLRNKKSLSRGEKKKQKNEQGNPSNPEEHENHKEEEEEMLHALENDDRNIPSLLVQLSGVPLKFYEQTSKQLRKVLNCEKVWTCKELCIQMGHVHLWPLCEHLVDHFDQVHLQTLSATQQAILHRHSTLVIVVALILACQYEKIRLDRRTLCRMTQTHLPEVHHLLTLMEHHCITSLRNKHKHEDNSTQPLKEQKKLISSMTSNKTKVMTPSIIPIISSQKCDVSSLSSFLSSSSPFSPTSDPSSLPSSQVDSPITPQRSLSSLKTFTPCASDMKRKNRSLGYCVDGIHMMIPSQHVQKEQARLREDTYQQWKSSILNSIK